MRHALLAAPLLVLGCASTVDIAGTGSGASATSGGSGGATSGTGSATSGTGGTAGSGGNTTAGTTFKTEPGFFDAVLDSEREQVFLSYGTEGVVRVVSLKDGAVTTVKTGYRAEHMYYEAKRAEVVISLPIKAHDPYWFIEDQKGFIAAIDATAPGDPTPIAIPLDPWQIVADGEGHAFASGASGQWTGLVSVDISTPGSAPSVMMNIDDGTNIRIHPDHTRIYGADNGLSPSDIERYDVIDGALQYAYDSPYHGDYEMCGDLRIHPAGKTIYTACGNVFLATNAQTSDMTFAGSMNTGKWADLEFHPDGQMVYVLRGKDTANLYVYDAETFDLVKSYPLSGPTDRLLPGASSLVLVRTVTGGSPATEIEVIPYSSL
jgi:hypothetical protein